MLRIFKSGYKFYAFIIGAGPLVDELKNFIRANKQEIKLNPRSRSAILRTAERVT